MTPVTAVGLFCDDIREEKAGTDSLVGVMPDSLNMPQFPGVLLRLSLYVRVLADPGTKLGETTLWLRLPDGKERHLQTIDAAVIDGSQEQARRALFPYAGLIMRVAFQNFPVPAPGRMDAIVKWRGGEAICAALNFQLTPEGASDARHS